MTDHGEAGAHSKPKRHRLFKVIAVLAFVCVCSKYWFASIVHHDDVQRTRRKEGFHAHATFHWASTAHISLDDPPPARHPVAAATRSDGRPSSGAWSSSDGRSSTDGGASPPQIYQLPRAPPPHALGVDAAPRHHAGSRHDRAVSLAHRPTRHPTPSAMRRVERAHLEHVQGERHQPPHQPHGSHLWQHASHQPEGQHASHSHLWQHASHQPEGQYASHPHLWQHQPAWHPVTPGSGQSENSADAYGASTYRHVARHSPFVVGHPAHQISPSDPSTASEILPGGPAGSNDIAADLVFSSFDDAAIDQTATLLERAAADSQGGGEASLGLSLSAQVPPPSSAVVLRGRAPSTASTLGSRARGASARTHLGQSQGLVGPGSTEGAVLVAGQAGPSGTQVALEDSDSTPVAFSSTNYTQGQPSLANSMQLASGHNDSNQVGFNSIKGTQLAFNDTSGTQVAGNHTTRQQVMQREAVPVSNLSSLSAQGNGTSDNHAVEEGGGSTPAQHVGEEDATSAEHKGGEDIRPAQHSKGPAASSKRAHRDPSISHQGDRAGLAAQAAPASPAAPVVVVVGDVATPPLPTSSVRFDNHSVFLAAEGVEANQIGGARMVCQGAPDPWLPFRSVVMRRASRHADKSGWGHGNDAPNVAANQTGANNKTEASEDGLSPAGLSTFTVAASNKYGINCSRQAHIKAKQACAEQRALERCQQEESQGVRAKESRPIPAGERLLVDCLRDLNSCHTTRAHLRDIAHNLTGIQKLLRGRPTCIFHNKAGECRPLEDNLETGLFMGGCGERGGGQRTGCVFGDNDTNVPAPEEDIQQRYPTCAVVGNHLKMFETRSGRSIDRHDATFRFNNEGTRLTASQEHRNLTMKDMPRFFGSKTTFRLLNRKYTNMLLQREFSQQEVAQDEHLVFWNLFSAPYLGQLQHLYRGGSFRLLATDTVNWQLDAFSQLRKDLYRLGLGPFSCYRVMSSGIHGVLLSLLLCQQVDVYGFR
eukprot:jgi/Mesvir1/23177/Mv22648-RA.2